MHIVVTSGTGDAVNTNQRLRRRIAHGFAELGHQSHALAMDDVPARLRTKAIDLVLVTGSIADPDVDLSWLVQEAQRVGCQVAFWLHDDPYEFDLHWRLLGLRCPVFTNEPNCIPYYPNELKAKALALAASPLDDLPEQTRSSDVSFDLGFCGVAFPQRVAVIRKLQDAGLSISCWGDQWPEDLACCVNLRLGPAGLRQLYRRCHYVLNLGREMPIANRRLQIASSMPGPRTFEAALHSTVQIYLSQSARISHYYSPEQGVIPATSLEEVKFLLELAKENPDRHRCLGSEARKWTMRRHLYRHRCLELLRALKEEDSTQ